MSTASRGEQPPIDPQWTHINAITDLLDVLDSNLAAAVVSVNQRADALQVLAGNVTPLEQDGKVFYQGVGLIVTRLTTARGVDICEARTIGKSAYKGFYDFGVSTRQLDATPPTRETAKVDSYITKILKRTQFDVGRSGQVWQETTARPNMLLGPVMAHYLVPRAIEADKPL